MNEVKNSLFFEDSLEEAEKSCFDVLTALLGYKSGENSFLASNPGLVNCMVFDIGYPSHPETMTFKSSSYCFRASADFYSSDRSLLQKMTMRLLQLFPSGGYSSEHLEDLRNTNVVTFRLAGDVEPIGKIDWMDIQARDGKVYGTRHLPVLFDVVFSVGKRPNE